MDKEALTKEEAARYISYDPNTGLFERVFSKKKSNIGRPITSLDRDGYLRFKVCGKNYLAHRLAFLFMTGKFPPLLVDHINGDRTDNRWCNLRNATHEINTQNARPRKNKAVPLLGVSRYGERFRTKITAEGKDYFLGYFKTAEEAHETYIKAKRQLHSGCAI